jgi:hypothetical protein
MRENRAIYKLIGLLYVLLLVVLCLSAPRVAVPTQSGGAGEEQGNQTITVLNPVEAMQQKDVSFKAGTFSTAAEEMTLILQPGETQLLEDFRYLRVLDATGSECYEELSAWAAGHPNVDVRFTLPMPVAGEVSNQTESLDLTGLSGEELPEVLRLAPAMTRLKTVELGSPDAGTKLNADELQLLREMLPQANIHYTVTLMGRELDPNTESLDLTGLSAESVESAAAALSTLPNLSALTIPGGEDGLCLEDALVIARAAPKAVISYPAVLYGKSFDLSDTGLDLNHIAVGDQGEAVRAVLPCMRACTWLDMDSCGVDNEHMAVIRDENPDVEVIWRVNFGTNYSVRTNVTKILASMPSKGGRLDDSTSAQLMYCTKVRYLDVGHNTDMANFDFIRYMPDLEVAVISMTAIEDLSPFADHAHLRYIEAGNTHIGDLSALASCPELRHLNIGTNINITDISPLYDLELKRLWIGSYTPVPQEQVDRMRELHPGCEVNTTVPSGLERDANGNGNEGYVLQGWKSYQNYLTVDWNYYAAHHAFPAQRPIGWYKVIFKCFDYNLANGAYSFSWNDPLFKEHAPGVKPVNVKIIDTSFLLEDWEDPHSDVTEELNTPPGVILYEFEH